MVVPSTRGAINGEPSDHLPRGLKTDEQLQQSAIGALASPYMGSNVRQGWTYPWLPNHLADAFSETSPRSFLIALRTAAEKVKDSVVNVLDHNAIRDSVAIASEVRVSQLQEDYPWIGEVLEPLADLEVPCQRSKFIERWRNAGTVSLIEASTRGRRLLGPLELADSPARPEEALLKALQNIGVVAQREDGKINIPDLFRVAARLKRRGGPRPPSRR